MGPTCVGLSDFLCRGDSRKQSPIGLVTRRHYPVCCPAAFSEAVTALLGVDAFERARATRRVNDQDADMSFGPEQIKQ
ncbi:hypothetical protein EVAR_24077_1 [Eumeta japonica]|uniref:Uncharacterized protein n=1 Tax=Eumeta variegata TaxID=151549 RepID=A0A4C2A9R6_EUMVA|nr:hypothetical protein EVAR_24077_1 [Eumeta japonica]